MPFITNSSRTLPEDSNPVVLVEKPEISRRPKPVDRPILNGNSNGTNGVKVADQSIGVKRKRSADQLDFDHDPIKKRGKVEETTSDESSLIFLDDSSNGAILIDDD